MVKSLLFKIYLTLAFLGTNVVWGQQEMSISMMAEKALVEPGKKNGGCSVFRTMESIRTGSEVVKGLKMAIIRHQEAGTLLLQNDFNEAWNYTIRKLNGEIVRQGMTDAGENRVEGLPFGYYLIFCESLEGISSLDQIMIAPHKAATAQAIQD